MKKLISLFLFAVLSHAQNTPKFPGTAATHQDLAVATDAPNRSVLSAPITASALTAAVSDGTKFRQYNIVTFADTAEQAMICSISSNNLTFCARGFGGTTATAHASGVGVLGLMTAWHHNQLAAEVKAIEGAMGAGFGQTPVAAAGFNGASQTYSVLKATDNGLDRVLQTRPNAETKRIVILGSSNAAGTNASSYANSWAGKFESAMTARGWTVINVSIGGQNTGQAVSRFWTDVAPLKPDIVIHAMAYRNQSYDYGTYTANTLRLIRMTEQIGAIPVVMGQYGDALATADNCKSILALERWKESIGVPTWNWLAATADSSCHFLLGLDSGDGIHPNDAGYEAQFNAIPLNMFERLLAQRGQQPPLPRPGVWQWSATDSTNNPMFVPLDRPAHSWTVAGFVRDGTANYKGMISIWTNAGATQLGRIRNSNNVIEWTSNVGTLDIATSYTAINRFWYHLAVTYNGATGVLALYVNGQLAGSGATGSDFTMDSVRFLSNNAANQQLTGGQLAQPVIYRVALPAEQIAALSRGVIFRAGVEWYSSLSGAPTTQMVSDLGTTTVATVYADSWTPVAGQFPFPITLIPTVAPTCDYDHSGQIIYSGHAPGVKDTVQVCAADASNAYAWRVIY